LIVGVEMGRVMWRPCFSKHANNDPKNGLSSGTDSFYIAAHSPCSSTRVDHRVFVN
jgi:hypothetical protein